MFGMRQGLELARLARIPVPSPRASKAFHDPRQEPRLRYQIVGFQAGGFSRVLQGREIDVRGEVLFAGAGQQIVARMMPVISPQRSRLSFG